MNYPTWSDLNNESIVPPLGSYRSHDIGSVAVMISCEPDLRFIKSNVAIAKAVPFFTSTLMTLNGSHKGACITGPFIGAPYAAMLLESLIAKGADKIVVVGWCGAVTDQFDVGDIILPSMAIVDEGTSANYKVLDKNMPHSIPDVALTDQLADQLTAEGIDFKRATIWTTDAIYRETHNKVAYFRQLGARAVEMECSALFSVAEYRKVGIAGLLVVSDSVASKDWDPGFRKKQFKRARQNACKSVMTFAKALCENE
ncbi:nucleoside phosphorylase [Desulfobacula toluolica]|uniref:Uridine phosphorylase n=1 Tax=Desulfobacula toluolica (strain DSM 7467 / Tol2) TaxID=651182 RepID=K0NHF5_DESTT|nr:nucleoside phosphorylase [Desulfobacula toluolica]CCK80380.1 putative purine nucleoside phosphorylase [Desulfobacula toluolica Tol2]